MQHKGWKVDMASTSMGPGKGNIQTRTPSRGGGLGASGRVDPFVPAMLGVARTSGPVCMYVLDAWRSRSQVVCT